MKQLFGGLLVAAGMLIMLTSGLCTVVVIGIGMTQAMMDPEIIGAIYLPLIVGGAPFAFGFGLYKWGRSLLRKPEDRNVF